MNRRTPQIRVDAGGRRAVLEVPDTLDRVLDVEAIHALARDAGVGPDRLERSRLARIAGAVAAGVRGRSFVIAVAQPAVDGDDGWVEWCSGSRCVLQGGVVGIVHAPGAGVDGHDVCGEVIAARPGRVATPTLGEGLAHDGDVIRATRSGVGCDVDGVRDVLPVSRVQAVRGSLEREGVMHVAGYVDDDVVLRATADLIVDTALHDVTLACGGTLHLQEPMAPARRGAFLVDGDVHAPHLERVRGRAKGRLDTGSLHDCDLIVGGAVDVCGAIVGGRMTVGGRVRAATLGSADEAQTIVVLAAAPLERVRLARLDRLCDSIAAELAELFGDQQRGRRGANMTRLDRERQTELSFEISLASERLDACETRRESLQQIVNDRTWVDLEVTETLRAGTILCAGRSSLRLRRDLPGPVTVSWDDAIGLVFRRGGGPTRALACVAEPIAFRSAGASAVPLAA